MQIYALTPVTRGGELSHAWGEASQRPLAQLRFDDLARVLDDTLALLRDHEHYGQVFSGEFQVAHHIC